MEALIDFVKANPVYAAGAALLVLFFVIALVKQAFKLAVIVLVLNGGYGYYLNDLAQEYYSQARDKVEAAQQKYDEVRDTVESASEAAKTANETADKAKDLFEQAGDMLDR